MNKHNSVDGRKQRNSIHIPAKLLNYYETLDS